jgi:NAD(P)-dependent dehydrogenase (short-subunit alcohol dehydrogenase family)
VTSLVLGGGGFIGGHLCEALLAAGERVRVLERPRLKLDDTPELRQHVEWHEGDFTNPVDVAEAIAGCDKVYHLISTTLPKTSNDNPVYDLESNVAATLRLLELIRQANFPCKIAWVLLAVADGIDLGHGEVSAADIERAVDCRVRFRHRPIGAKESVWTRQMFIHFVTEWLQRLGCLQQPPKAPNVFVAQIDAFARQMRDERGLSPPFSASSRRSRFQFFVFPSGCLVARPI